MLDQIDRKLINKVFLCLLFSNGPQRPKELSRVTGDTDLDALIGNIEEHIEGSGLPLRVIRTAGGYRISSDPAYHDFLTDYFKKEKKVRFSKASMDVLTIIAYKQPITLSEISRIRGINSEGPVKTLLEKDIIEIKGRKDAVGRPLIFATTSRFLEVFGLDDLDDLPMPEEINLLRKGTDNEDS